MGIAMNMAKRANTKFHQTSFQLLKAQKAYGGTIYRSGKDRSARTVDSKARTHLVLKTDKAKGDWSFRNPKHKNGIFKAIQEHSRACGVRVTDLAIQRDHIHMIIQFKRRSYYFRWIRRITAAIAFRVTGWNKNKSEKLKFWTLRPFTRIIHSFKHLSIAKDYVALNMLEAIGMIRWNQKRLSGLSEIDSKNLALFSTG